MRAPSAGGRPSAAVVAEVAAFLPDVVRMFAGVVRDERVPRADKVTAGAFLALGVSPLDAIPVVGEVQAVAMVLLATRQLVKAAGEDVLREHWRGSEQGFRTLLFLVETGLRPGRIFRRSFRLARERA